MTAKDFILNYLNLEKNNEIEKLMKVNLNNNFELTEASTKISNGIDEIIKENKNQDEEEEDELDKSIEKRIDKIFERGRFDCVRDYIDSKPKIENFFPYEQKKYKREKDFLKGIDKSKKGRNILYELDSLTGLNKKIKEYKIKNREKGALIGIEQEENDEDENEEDENGEEEDEEENNEEMEIE